MRPIKDAMAKTAALKSLGLDPEASATAEDVRAAWRRMALETHPDRPNGSPEAFTRARTAYTLLRRSFEAGETRLEPAPKAAAPKQDQRPEAPGQTPEPPRASAEAARAARAANTARQAHSGHGNTTAEASGDPAGPTPSAAPRRPATAGARPKVATRVDPIDAEVLSACRRLLGAGPDGITAIPDTAADAELPTDHVPRAIRRAGRRLTYIVATPLETGDNRVALPTAPLRDSREADPQLVSFRSPKSGTGRISIPEEMRSRLFPGARSVNIQFADSAT